MAQETQHANSTKHFGGVWSARKSTHFSPKQEDDEGSHTRLEQSTVHPIRHFNPVLGALGDEFSRKILLSSISSGKTVEEISADQNLPLSTCYRRVRQFVDDGLMVLERIVITQTGKRYAVYRTAFSGVTIKLDSGEVSIDTTPNADVRDKLLTKWLTTNYPAQNQDDPRLLHVEA